MATNKNITMKQFNGTDYDTLYPKTIASQIPDVYSKTDTITATTLSQLGLSANKLPNDAFQQIKTLIDNVQSSSDSKARIQTGSYVGTGTYGANNPCSLTFDFIPQFIIFTNQKTDDPKERLMPSFTSSNILYNYIMFNMQILTTSYVAGAGFGSIPSNGPEIGPYGKKSADGKTVYWYTESDSYYQFNEKLYTYYWVAFS